jgi:four helix bundle protein
MTLRTMAEWEANVPSTIREDTLWTVEAYRLALFASALAYEDVQKLKAIPLAWGVADQLYRAVGSVGANIAEGYSRSGNRERAHFYEYALGSARESRHWYMQAPGVLDQRVIDHRLSLLSSIVRLLIRIL